MLNLREVDTLYRLLSAMRSQSSFTPAVSGSRRYVGRCIMKELRKRVADLEGEAKLADIFAPASAKTSSCHVINK